VDHATRVTSTQRRKLREQTLVAAICSLAAGASTRICRRASTLVMGGVRPWQQGRATGASDYYGAIVGKELTLSVAGGIPLRRKGSLDPLLPSA